MKEHTAPKFVGYLATCARRRDFDVRAANIVAHADDLWRDLGIVADALHAIRWGEP